jgi:hypothetical protein
MLREATARVRAEAEAAEQRSFEELLRIVAAAQMASLRLWAREALS